MNNQVIRGADRHMFPAKTIFRIAGLVIMLIAALVTACQAQGNKVKKEIIIKVQANTIALPGNLNIARVPISAARVRSTDLRNLNKKYNAARIERLYQVRTKSQGGGVKDVKASLVSKEKPVEPKKEIDLSRILARETKAKLEAEGKLAKQGQEIAQAEDTFLLQFEFEPGKEPNMNQLVREYLQLPVVIDAQYITRK